MAVAIAAKNSNKPTTLTGAESVNKSFPEFWRYF
jgi:5-enolpyruvylshikimate-3-phosphate synthase